MKKLLVLFILLLLSAPSYAEDRLAWGGSCMVVGGGVESAAGCATKTQYFETVESQSDTGAVYYATKITAGSNMSVCKVELNGFKHASETADWVIEIWSHDGGADEPDALIASTATIPNASVPGTALTWFGGSITASLTNAGTYWIVGKKTGTTTAYSFAYGRGNTVPERLMTSPDGTTWTLLSTSRGGHFRLYTQ